MIYVNIFLILLVLTLVYCGFLLVKLEWAFKISNAWIDTIYEYRIKCIKKHIEPQVDYSDINFSNKMLFNPFKGYTMFDYIDIDKIEIIINSLDEGENNEL